VIDDCRLKNRRKKALLWHLAPNHQSTILLRHTRYKQNDVRENNQKNNTDNTGQQKKTYTLENSA